MNQYKLVKVFDLAVAPAALREAEELQVLRKGNFEEDEPMLKVWVGSKATTIEPPSELPEAFVVSEWEYHLHGWLSQAGAEAGDTVLLTWTDGVAERSAACHG